MSVKYKILIECTRLVEPLRDGCWRYVYELLKEISLHNDRKNLDIDLYINGRIIKLQKIKNHLFFDRNPKMLRLGRFGRIYNKMSFLLSNRIERYDLVHFTTPIRLKPFIGRVKNKLVVTVHDLTHKYYPQFHTDQNVQETENGFEFAVKNGVSFIAVSGSTKDDFVKEYKVSADKVEVIYEGADREKFRKISDDKRIKIIARKYLLPDTPYFLALSTLEPRKNIKTIIEAFELFKKSNPGLEVNLVIAGKRGWKWESMELEKYECKDSIFFTGYIDEQDLRYIYNGAIAFCYLSFYEGFGLPPVEALCCGTPVIYADNSSLKEILFGGGMPVDPHVPKQTADAMEQLVKNPLTRSSYSEKALEISDKYSWSETARQTIAHYLLVLDRLEGDSVN